MRRERPFSWQSGFTVIELMIVVAVLGILAAVAIPAFMKNARKAKTAEATINIKKLYDGARSYYEEEHSDRTGAILPKQFPDLFSALFDTGPADGGADSELASGSAGGYDFAYTPSADRQSFMIVATPTVPGVTGEAVVSTDQTGDVALVEDPAVAQVDEALRERAVAAVERLDRLTGGAALGAARSYLESPGAAQRVWAALVPDPANGGTLRELLDRAPAVAADLTPAAAEWDEGGDPAAAQQVFQEYLEDVRSVAEPILDDAVGDVEPPAGGVDAPTLELLAGAQPVTASEALDYLRVLENHLDPRADMTLRNPTANAAHRATLVRAAGRAEQALARAQSESARRALFWTRRFTDGNAPDWIAEPAAGRIRLQVDLALRLAARRR